VKADAALGRMPGRSLAVQPSVAPGSANEVELSIGHALAIEAQFKELSAAGCEKIFREQVSSITLRVQLQSALEFVREGDVFVVTKLDRLARSVADMMAILQALERKRVVVRILNLGMDTQTPTGKLMLTVLGGVAQFEREMMLERQREGIAKAKSAGKYKGRKPIAPERQQHVLRLAAEGDLKLHYCLGGNAGRSPRPVAFERRNIPVLGSGERPNYSYPQPYRLFPRRGGDPRWPPCRLAVA
jgi:DNA invertase Pin-like site-specific DNA recombinase